MDTSPAEEVQHTATTLQADSFFLYVALPQFYHVRLFCPFFLNPPSAVTIRRVPFSRN